MASSFCPHLTFRLASRHKRCSEKNHLSEEDISVINKSSTSSTSDCTGSINTNESLSEVHEGSGEPANLHVGSVDEKSVRDFKKTGSSRKDLLCQECEALGLPAPKAPHHLWRCLEPKCKLYLCGKQSQDHSQQHCQENPAHVLQENAVNRKIWCNDCSRQVFPDFRNRRPAPGVWIPSEELTDEAPRGLFNIGNTCFMNAALQCMAAVKPLNSYFLGHGCSLKGKNVANSYLWFLSEMWSTEPYSKGVMPSRLLHAVRAAHPIFRGFQQHDTQEFLRLFMDTLAEETRVPHFSLCENDDERSDSSSSEDGMSSDSETESFETCDSGNASEETMSTDIPAGDARGELEKSKKSREVKITMKSIVSEIFDGQVESSAQCLSCKQISSRLEVFQDLSLPIPTREELTAIRSVDRYEADEGKAHPGWVNWIWEWVKSLFWGPSPTLEDCFAAFFSSDELKGKNMYSCEKCQKLRNGVKRCSLYRLPEILCVHLKRFRMYEYSGGMGFSGKVSQYVQFPLEGLDLGPFLNRDCSNAVTTYRLMGAICHIGSFLGGHYTSFIRRDDQWYLCDDSRVVPVSPETVAECEAYVLFYQKSEDQDESISKLKEDIFSTWTSHDDETIDEKRNVLGSHRYHLLSRKWLNRFVWGDEPGPIDNSDVVCPHGFIVPYETVHLGATWVPHSVWEMLCNRFGGGPDLVQNDKNEECVICSAAWKKHVKATNSDRERNSRGFDGLN